MGFLKELAGQINNQFSIGENTDQTLDAVINGQKEKYVHSILGTNARMSEIEATSLIFNLRYLDEAIQKRNDAAKRYIDNLSGNKSISFPKIEEGNLCSYYIFSIWVKGRDFIKRELETKGIYTGLHYPVSLHLQPCYKHLGYKNRQMLENAEIQFFSQLSLPLFWGITNDEIDYVSKHLNNISI
ncbi:MAG: DegT/DnrJ/EryC1/StrS family aminotransferase [Nanoarchaeota archaeon]